MIRWNDNYITGIEKLDKEHQQLFQMADQVLNKFGQATHIALHVEPIK